MHGKPVTVGWNVVKTHPRYTSKKHTTIHAEVKAVISAQCSLDGGVAYVYRESNGHPALAKPCDLCYTVLQESGVKKVFYSIDSYPYWEKERIK
jgi:pyrimidine deaminase RibD-like protein